MVIDSSAVLAILQNETERRAFNQAIAAAEQCAMSAATLVELSIVMEARFGPDGQGDLDQDQAQLAREAFSRYGKGRHRASLNFGDCFSYALAKWRHEPLLFRGNNFCHTDLLPACLLP